MRFRFKWRDLEFADYLDASMRIIMALNYKIRYPCRRCDLHPASERSMACASNESIKIMDEPGGRGFRLEAIQVLPVSRERIFQFFSDAMNLQELTPPWLHFTVLSSTPIQMAAGTLIDYRLRLYGLPLRWQSRIAVWEPPLRFVDEQVRGPYRRWHHEHSFEATEAGTICRDTVDYRVLGGRLIHPLLVRPDLLKIFTYRQQKLRELFPAQDERGA